jgi:hypothetical protein
MKEPEDGNYNIDYNSDDYGDLIRPIIDKDAYYVSDSETLTSGFTEPIGVFMASGNVNSTPDVLSTPINVENAVVRAAELEAMRVSMLETTRSIEEE